MSENHQSPESSSASEPAKIAPGAGSKPSHSPRRKRAWLIVVALLIAGWLAWQQPWRQTDAPQGQSAHHGRRYAGNQVQPVQAATVTRGDIPIVINALGSVTPLATVTVKTQLAGTLQSIAFKEGQIVKKGDVLAQIDPRPYQISLANAQGVWFKDQALLQQARIDLKRYQTLLAQDSIAKQQVDTQASLVKQYEGQVKSDQANIDTYKLDLMYARITAPISGRVGLRQVDAGNYITPSDANGIAVITQLQPISVLFSTSEDNLPSIAEQTRQNPALSTTVYDRANIKPLATGHLETFDNQIDTTTGTLKLRALFDNADQALFPNQFVNVRLLVKTLRDALIVPTSAVLNGANGPFVYVIKSDNTVTVRPVKPGPVDGERTSIITGLALGERVVTDGSDRLREGAQVSIPSAAIQTDQANQAHPTHKDLDQGPSASKGHRHHSGHSNTP